MKTIRLEDQYFTDFDKTIKFILESNTIIVSFLFIYID